jgi:hypothetical protein
MSDDDWLLVIAIICAIPYGAVIAILLWRNPKSWNAWTIGLSSLVVWPFLILGGPSQLLLVIPLATKFIVDGTNIDKPVSPKTIYWALGVISVLMLGGAAIAMLHDTDWKW